MRTIKTYWILCLAAMAVACGGDSLTDPVDPGTGEYEPFDPPVEVNTNNVFKICVFSTLSDEALFSSRDQTVVSDFINAASGVKPLIYLLERSDFEIGKPLPHVNVACKSKSFAFFAQQAATADAVKGTGLITRYTVNNYDGVDKDGFWMSGCLLTAPLAKTTEAVAYTTRIENFDQVKTMVAERGSVLQYNGVVVGSIQSTIKTEVATYLKTNFKNYRLAFAQSADTTYDLFVLTPVDYVCRQIEAQEKVNLPYYTVSIEKL